MRSNQLSGLLLCQNQRVTVVISKMVGCMLPLLASKIHLDPAIMASPLITTLVDIFSILIYFNVATMLFNL